MKSFAELAETRQSCRAYEDRPVELEKVKECIRIAGLSPSACNSQPWSFLLIRNRDLTTKMAPFLQEDGFNQFADQCPNFVLVMEEPAELIDGKSKTKKCNQRFAQLDLGMSVMQFCLAATEIGLSTCIMSSFREEKIASLLNLTYPEKIRLIIAIGYAKTNTIRKKQRKPLEEIFQVMD